MLTQDLPGRISAFRVAEVRARVDGIVLRRLFTEGADVKEGQVLYEIDPAPSQAALDSARGTLARAEANAAAARLKEERFKQLIVANAISKQDYEDAVANEGIYNADILSGKAAVQTAQINLDYTKVTSPVAGRIGISQVTEGAFVRASAATLLATVQQLDPVYVDVTQASSELLRWRRDLASGRLKADSAGRARVKLIQEAGEIYPQEGSLQFSDVTVNAMSSRRAASRIVCPGAVGRGQPAGCHPGSAACGQPQFQRRADSPRGGRKRHGGNASSANLARCRQSMVGHRRIASGRPGDRRQPSASPARSSRDSYACFAGGRNGIHRPVIPAAPKEISDVQILH
jgi:RND family efflux transporter MFP subunit